MTTLLIIGAAVALLWPSSLTMLWGLTKLLPDSISLPKAIKPTSSTSCIKATNPTFIEATQCLANVKSRLNATEQSDDDTTAAINTLQLSLTAGSDE
jgi:hypothetical protein